MEEEISSSKRRRIEESVMEILKNSDLDTATEYSVRTAASQQLSIDLSDLASKICVREILESFLLSTTAAPTPDDVVGNDKVAVAEATENSGRVVCKLSDKRNLAIHGFRKGQTLVSIRDYYQKDGKQFPSGRGITLTGRQWSCFRNNFSAIEEAIAQMQSKIRSVAAQKVSEENMPSSVDDVALQGSAAIDQTQMETYIPNSVSDLEPQSLHHIAVERNEPQAANCASPSASVPQGHLLHNQLANPPQSLVPIMTARLNGKNYHCWMHQMEFFLKQLKVGYVLTDPCPSIPIEGASFEEITQAKIAAKKWADDEYICRHSILNSLSDNLFDEYSKKSYRAKELWEELKSVYSEDFGTVRSEVNKYIQFQMVDGVSVLEQVQELNYIANSITSSGIWIDENLHVSVIISKLPPSWKEYRAKLMYHEFLPLNMLLHLLKAEEESRDKRDKSKKDDASENGHVADVKPKDTSELKRKEGKKLVCYNCRKEGHISKHCPDRKLDTSERAPERARTWHREPRDLQTNRTRRTADS